MGLTRASEIRGFLAAMGWWKNKRANMEFSIPDTDVKVRQGDVLLSREPKSGQVEEVCIVITADCDISKGKFGHQLACLRVISLETYIRTVWARHKLEKMQKDEAEKLRGQVAKWHTRQLGSASQLSATAAVSWVRREEPLELCRSLQVPDDECKKFVTALTTFRSAFSALDGGDQNNALSKYAELRAICNKQDIQSCRQAVLQQAQKETFPEDVFLLPNLPQIEKSAWVIMLREVVGIAYDAVCYRITDATTSEKFLRVGRLQPTFKYAVSQAFGTLYSRIGMPTEYEVRCQDVIQNINNYSWE